MRKTWRTATGGALLALALAGCGSAGEGAPEGATTSQSAGYLEQQGFSVPAEWEPHESVWMATWVAPYSEPLFPMDNVVTEVAQALTRYVPINLAVQSADEEATWRATLARSGVNLSRVRFRTFSHNDFWLRDTGGVFTRNRRGELGVLDWGYDTWSYDLYTSDYSQHDERIDRDIAFSLSMPAFRCGMVHEGGNTEVDGHGTAIVTESVERMRNPHMTLSEMETELERCYGVRQVIWLPQGVLEDDATFRGVLPGGLLTSGATNGHVDDYVRFAPNNTILLAQVRPEDMRTSNAAANARARINNQRLEANYRILSRARDAQGRPYRIVRVPVAEPDLFDLRPGEPFYDLFLGFSPLEDGTVLHDGDTLHMISTTSYLNFFVSNGVVLMPSYAESIGTPAAVRKDREVYDILRAAFPGRDVVRMRYSIGANRGAGGVHCMTQQQPLGTAP